ncbi:MAG: hypothetical protein ACE5JS_15495 [Nitrospinota bacterium]
MQFPSSVEIGEEENLIVEGAIEQGVDWFRVTDRIIFNTFVRLRYVVDTEAFDFNNRLSPQAGLKLKLPLSDWGLVEAGAKFVGDFRFREPRRLEEGFLLFLAWGAWWDINPRARSPQ